MKILKPNHDGGWRRKMNKKELAVEIAHLLHQFREGNNDWSLTERFIMLKVNVFVQSETAAQREQAEEAKAALAQVQSERDLALADNAAMTEVLFGSGQVFRCWDSTQREKTGRVKLDLVITGEDFDRLKQPHPGQALLDRIKELEQEFKRLRRFKENVKREEFNYDRVVMEEEKE